MKRTRRVILILLLLLVLPLFSALFYSCAAENALEREIAETPRDQDTGLVLGTEPVTLQAGGDRACLLIHGWLGSRIDFNELGKRLLEKGVTVRMMLLPGHGTTPRDLEEQDGDDFLKSVRNEFQALRERYGDVTLVGFSLGGALATIVASESCPLPGGAGPDRLVLAAPYFDITYRFYYILPADLWNSLLSPFVDYVIKSSAFVRVNREEAKEKIFSYRVIPTRAVTVLNEVGARARHPDLLEHVTCPILVLHSINDMAACADAAEEAYELLGSRSKEFVSFERSDHHLFWDHDRDEVLTRIVDFVAGGI